VQVKKENGSEPGQSRAGAGSQKPEAGSRKLAARSQKPEAGSWKP